MADGRYFLLWYVCIVCMLPAYAWFYVFSWITNTFEWHHIDMWSNCNWNHTYGQWCTRHSNYSRTEAINEHRVVVLYLHGAGWTTGSLALRFLANVNSRSRSLYAIARPSVVCLSVCRLSVCNVRAPYSGGSNFRQYFYGIRYIGHPSTSTENFTEIVPVEPLRRGS